MSRDIKVIVDGEIISLSNYCMRLSKRNNAILYQIESYLDKKLLEDEALIKIRDNILTVSAEINKLSNSIICGECNEGLQ